MELDEIKKLWSEYDKKLNENLKLNEKLLQKMNFDKSKQEIQKPLMYEIFSVIILFITIVFLTKFSFQFIEEIQYSLTGFSSVILGTLYLLFAIIKVNKFIKIDYYNSTVIKLQKDILLLKTAILRIRKIELFLLPFFIITLLPILFKGFHNINLFENLRFFSIEVGLILVIGYPVFLWINKNLYDNKLKDAELLLKETENYEKDKYQFVAST